MAKQKRILYVPQEHIQRKENLHVKNVLKAFIVQVSTKHRWLMHEMVLILMGLGGGLMHGAFRILQMITLTLVQSTLALREKRTLITKVVSIALDVILLVGLLEAVSWIIEIQKIKNLMITLQSVKDVDGGKKNMVFLVSIVVGGNVVILRTVVADADKKS